MTFRLPRRWKDATAISLLAHAAFLLLVANSASLGLAKRDKEYLPVQLVQLGTAGEIEPASHKAKEEEPKPPEPRKEIPKAEDMLPQPALQEKAPPPVEAAAVAAPEGSASSEKVFLPMHKLEKLPYFKLQVQPVYPAAERAAGVEARVVAEVYISEGGLVDDVKIVKTGGRRFDRAVITALQGSRFEPGYVEGKAVAVRVQIPFTFKLD